MRLQQMANQTETFFGCSRFLLCKRVAHTFILWKHVFRRLRIHVQQIGRELYNVECSSRISCVTPQEQQFLLEQLLHPALSGFTGQEARRGDCLNVSRRTAEDQGEQGSSGLATHDAEDLNNSGVLQSVRVWTDKIDGSADTWEAAIRDFNKVGVSSCFLMEIHKGCLQPSIFDDSIFVE